LTNEKISAETQIHTHMCYSEFNEILESIHAVDSGVISIEASRSKGEIIEKFEEIHYDRGIGLGVYDIHPPMILAEKEIILYCRTFNKSDRQRVILDKSRQRIKNKKLQ
jgi:5-methyltetrahydropteroyltriglutamate--homocysteine methyltransferase